MFYPYSPEYDWVAIGDGTMALLAITAETPEAALELIEEAMTKSGQMNRWLDLNGWIDETERNGGL